MNAPKLVIVGTGRSGTKSVAATLSQICWSARVLHEPNKLLVVPYTGLYLRGKIDQRTFLEFLAQAEWGDVVVDHRLALVVRDLRLLWPDTHFLWVRRDLPDTIASMVRSGWYADDERTDETIYWGDEGWNCNYAGWRLTAPPDLATPVERCTWYCQTVEGMLHDQQVDWVRVESITPEPLAQLCERVGLTVDMVPGEMVRVLEERVSYTESIRTS